MWPLMPTIESSVRRTSAAPWEPSLCIRRPDTIAADPIHMRTVVVAHAQGRPSGEMVRARFPAVTSIGGDLAATVVACSSSAVCVFGTSPEATTYFGWAPPGSAIRQTTRSVHPVTSGAAATSCAVERWSVVTTGSASLAGAPSELRHVVNAIRRRDRFTFSDEFRSLLGHPGDAHAEDDSSLKTHRS
jgi:hypothetical protein